MSQGISLSQRQLYVPNKLLFALYTVIPLCLAAAFIDTLFFNHALRNFLPSNPGAIMWWAIVFNFPHIISSLVTLADKEYIEHYKPQFIKAIVIIVTGVFLVNFVMPAIVPDKVGMGMYGVFFVFFLLLIPCITCCLSNLVLV